MLNDIIPFNFEGIQPIFAFGNTSHKIHGRSLVNARLNKFKKVLTTTSCVVVFLLSCNLALASTPEYFNRVVSAIYRAEGGERAKVPYGILSVKVSSKEEARKVCYNTVRNNWKRWEASGRPCTYLSFLANRYCPISDPRDTKGLNKNWYKNVSYFMGEK